MILIIASAEDTHARVVGSTLERMGRAFLRVDFANLGRSLFISHQIGGVSILFDRETGITVSSEEIDAVWLRRPGRMEPSGIVSETYREFALREWRDCIWGWFGQLGEIVVNPLASQELAVKPLQLEMARVVGLPVPETCISNNPDEIRQFVDRFDGKVVHKSLTQSKTMLFDTMAWGPVENHFVHSACATPVMVQQRVTGRCDIRATVIGDRIHAARIESPPDMIDSRLADVMNYTSCLLPFEVEQKLHNLFDELGLVFGTVDLKEGPEGELFFLEINPQGQFLYIEIVTGLPLVANFTEFLATFCHR